MIPARLSSSERARSPDDIALASRSLICEICAARSGLGVAWADLPTEQLVARLGDETDADVRYAAALALARQAEGSHGTEAQQALNRVADSGAPAARLTARVARAFVGRADAMVAFLHILRDGA